MVGWAHPDFGIALSRIRLLRKAHRREMVVSQWGDHKGRPLQPARLCRDVVGATLVVAPLPTDTMDGMARSRAATRAAPTKLCAVPPQHCGCRGDPCGPPVWAPKKRRPRESVWQGVALVNPLVYLISDFRRSFYGTRRRSTCHLPRGGMVDFQGGLSAQAIVGRFRSGRRPQ